MRAGFSLIEAILVIGVIAVLLTIGLPQLGRVRHEARSTVSLANLRTHAATISLYHGDWNDAYPLFVDPKSTETILRFGGRRPPITLRYFWAWWGWSYALADLYYDGQYSHRAFYDPHRTRRAASSNYYYSCSLVARPEYWNPTSRTGRAQWGRTRVDEVLFPASKCLFTDGGSLVGTELPQTTHLARYAFADASAQQMRIGDIAPGYFRGDGYIPESHHFGDVIAGLHTIDGVRGRDRR